MGKRITTKAVITVSLFALGDTFTARLPNRVWLRRYNSYLSSGNNEFDDFGSIGGEDESAASDGEALAKEFYKQLKEREESSSSDKKEETFPSDSAGPKDTFDSRADNGNGNNDRIQQNDYLTPAEARFINREAFANRREVVAGKDIISSTNKKFTGAPSSSSSAGLFSGSGQSVFSVPSTPRERMIQNEMNLVTRADRSIGIQAVFALVLLVFYLTVGLTGGIEANDWSLVEDSLDTSLEGIEQIMPQPSDTETSVWL